MKQNEGRREALAAAAAAIAATLVFLACQRLLEPKYMDEIYEGAMMREYYDEELSHDVIFVGDCEVYDNISPVALWEGYGITSYVRGGPNQLAWQSYAIIEDTLKREKPKALVFSVLALHQGEPESEPYNRLNLDAMPLGTTKYRAVKASMTPGESVVDGLVPLLRYHSRWQDLNASDFTYFFNPDEVSFKGYMMRADVKPVGVIPRARRLQDYSLPETSMEYLDKMAALCKSQGVPLILYKAHSIYPHWYPEWDQQIKDWASKNNAGYVNLLEVPEQTGIDLNTDTYDAGLHLNVYGAEKAALFLGKYLSENYGMAGHRGEEAYEAEWGQTALEYHEFKALQERQVSTSGKISAFKR
ncbi:MAG: SGNH/GDSL hydrolase family protein [Clostridiales bacterium]|nr:SGNH/GDSL hydrolase family protein [Clostridiales bacterium]